MSLIQFPVPSRFCSQRTWVFTGSVAWGSHQYGLPGDLRHLTVVQGNPEHERTKRYILQSLNFYVQIMGELWRTSEKHGRNWRTWIFSHLFHHVSKSSIFIWSTNPQITMCSVKGRDNFGRTPLMEAELKENFIHYDVLFFCLFFNRHTMAYHNISLVVVSFEDVRRFLMYNCAYMLFFACLCGRYLYWWQAAGVGWSGDPGCQTWQWVRDAKICWKLEVEIHMNLVVVWCCNTIVDSFLVHLQYIW